MKKYTLLALTLALPLSSQAFELSCASAPNTPAFGAVTLVRGTVLTLDAGHPGDNAEAELELKITSSTIDLPPGHDPVVKNSKYSGTFKGGKLEMRPTQLPANSPFGELQVSGTEGTIRYADRVIELTCPQQSDQ